MKKLFSSRMANIKPNAINELFSLISQPGVVSFGGGYPDPELFPIEKIKQAFGQALDKHGKAALQYTISQGILPLRRKVAERMAAIGINCDPENEIILLQGGQQGLDLVPRLLIDKGDVIALENPTFLGATGSFAQYQPEYAPISMDADGMRMDELENALKTSPRVKFIYTIPDFQNPTGRTMSLERRKKMLELARAYDVLILEDSPYRDLRYEGEPVAPIKSLDTEGRVIYLGTFSKILAPGLRLGWVAASPEIVNKLVMLKKDADSHCSTINMYAVDAFLEMFDIDEHIARLRANYKRKKDLMINIIREVFPKSIAYTDPAGGLFTWLTFPQGFDATAIMKTRLLPEAKVAYVPGDSFFPAAPEANHARVNYSFMTDEQINSGIRKMGEVLAKYL